ncbi:3-deoxy-D-manno-octulosonic acid transferase [Kiloniella antarctica]|uniref:3-deoxy-D-manno-octulosonic acid transferase n=1 Tax=Kiloniella antarctica TaxID=1550907 RepID=A0ABW5BDP7_9PROT
MTTSLTQIALKLYGTTATLLTPLIKYHLKSRRLRGKEHPERHPERLGYSVTQRPSGPLLWIHGASVGESLSILPLITALNAQQSNLKFLITTGTTTSAELMAKRLPENAIHQFVPVDIPAAIERFIEHWSPDLGLIVESELWPQLIFRSANHNIPLLLINGRMSKKSTKSWYRFPFFIKDLLACFRIVMAQSQQDARHFRQLGSTQVLESGNLKFSADKLSYDSASLDELTNLIKKRPVWFASSTHKGEELFFARVQEKLKAKIPNILCIVAPRHPNRGPDILAELGSTKLKVSARSKSETIYSDTDLYLADTLGELGLFYELSPIVVMAGSFLRKGGQNLLEPARQNCAIICGPEMQNFEAICDEMIEADAIIKLRNTDQLENQLIHLLSHTEERRELAKTASHYMTSKGEEIHAIAARVLEEL